MRVSKKQENGPVKKNAKPPGKEKSRYYTAGPVHPCPVVKSSFYKNLIIKLTCAIYRKNDIEIIINLKNSQTQQLQNPTTVPCNERERLNLISTVMFYVTEIKTMSYIPMPKGMVKRFPVK